MEKKQPTKDDVTKLRNELGDWQEKNRSKPVMAGHQPGPAEYMPEPSQFVPRVQSVLIEVRTKNHLPVLEAFVGDPDSVGINDVLRELTKAQQFLA